MAFMKWLMIREGCMVEQNPIVWWELATHDCEVSASFFKKVFGWDVVYDERVEYYRVMTGSQASRFAGGTIFTLRRARLPFLTLYIKVEDVHEKRRLVEESGGFIVEEPFEIVGGSFICLFNEPSGVTFAMIQPAK